MSPIEYNQEMQGYANTVKESLTEEGIRLPFPYAVMSWMNGDTRNKRSADPTYYGGWSVGADSMEELIAQTGIGIHSSFVKTSIVNSENEEYDAYVSRNITIAVCAKRKKWVDKIDEVTGKVISTSSHIQILALTAELNAEKKVFSAWAPVMLTAKGYSAKFIEDALGVWDSATAASRREFAGGMPSQFFWAALGTFGTEPIFVSVGKAQKKSITPCKAWLPKEFNDALITRHFVGNENMARMAELAKQSEEWRKAWATKEGDKAPGAPDNFAEPGADVVPNDMNDIPF